MAMSASVSFGDDKPNDHINYDPIERWRHRAAQLPNILKKMEQWSVQPKRRVYELEKIRTEWDTCLAYHKCTGTATNEVCELCAPLSAVNDALRDLKKLEREGEQHQEEEAEEEKLDSTNPSFEQDEDKQEVKEEDDDEEVDGDDNQKLVRKLQKELLESKKELLESKKELLEKDKEFQKELLEKDKKFQKELLEKDKKLLEKDIISTSKEVSSKCLIIFERIGKTNSNLNGLCERGNNSQSHSSKRTSAEASLPSSKQSKSRQKTGETTANSSFNSNEDPANTITEIQFLEPLATYDSTPIAATFPEPPSDENKTLRKFQAFLDEGFKNKTVGGDEDKFLATVTRVMMWEAEKGDDGSKMESVTDDGVVLKEGSSNEDENGFYLLSLQANELKLSHKMMYAIMFRIASILKIESMITHEQHTKVKLITNKKSKKIVDFMIGCVRRHLQMLSVYTVSVPVEIKAISNKSVNYQGLQAKGVNQVIGHLAKSLIHAFRFGGVGKDSKVRGAVLTLISIEVLELELKHAGTSNSQIIVRTSGNCPLFSRATTLSLLGGDESQLSALESILPEAQDSTRGINLLAELMQPRPSLVFLEGEATYSDDVHDCQAKKALGGYLGSGTFSNVYQLESDVVIKVPKDPTYIKGLEDEMKMLDGLEDERIPKAEQKLGWLTIHMRCEISTLKCLKLKGVVGVSASCFVFENHHDLARVCCEVGKALDHAHNRNIAHLDVRPANIIISDIEPNKLKVLLIDWGLAATFKRKLTGFRGCLPFAHDDLLKVNVDETGGKTKPDEASDDEVSDNEASDDEALDDEALDDEVSYDEASDDEVSDDEVSDDEALDDEASDDDDLLVNVDEKGGTTKPDETTNDSKLIEVEASDDETMQGEMQESETKGNEMLENDARTPTHAVKGNAVKKETKTQQGEIKAEDATTGVATPKKPRKRQKRWFPSTEHDFASLAYTATAMMFRLENDSSSIPWHGFIQGSVDDSALESRRELVKTSLGVLNEKLEGEVKGELACYLGKLYDGAGINPAESG